jgi:peptidoglycan/xylan/chitin deacetylase (PgdA/CDA1 family)
MHPFATLALAMLIPAAAAARDAVVIDNASPLFRSTRRAQAAILLYHKVARQGFEPQMERLAATGFRTMTLDHLTSWIVTGLPSPPPMPVIITFDDNYLSIRTVAYPVLKERGFSGVNYAHAAFVGVKPGLTGARGLDHADWDEIRQMEREGVIFTESHCVNHRRLAPLPPGVLDAELTESLAAIRANIPGKGAVHLAYPYGRHDDEVVTRALAAGYATAATTVRSYASRACELHRLPRFDVSDAAPPADISATAEGALRAEPWQSSAAGSGFVGVDYVLSPPGLGDAVAGWVFRVEADGIFEVSARWPRRDGLAHDASYTIAHADGVAVVRTDQSQRGGEWVPLGTFRFTGGVNHSVSLGDPAGGAVAADAVRVAPAGKSAAP